jgi:hypothetical protein
MHSEGKLELSSHNTSHYLISRFYQDIFGHGFIFVLLLEINNLRIKILTGNYTFKIEMFWIFFSELQKNKKIM